MASLKFDHRIKRWRVRWHITCWDGTVDKGSQSFRYKAEAEDFRCAVERKADRLKSGLSKPTETIGGAVDKWLAFNRQHTARTQEHYKRVISKFAASLPSQVGDIQQINTGHVQAYLASLIDKLIEAESTNPNRTANTHLTAIKSFCRWLCQVYSIDNVAATTRMFKENPPNQRFLEPAEYDKVLDIAEGCDKDIIRFLAHTGLRATEFCSLKPENISRDKKRVTIIGKGRKQRSVPLNSLCRGILKRVKPKPNTRIFFSKSNYKSPRHVLYKVCAGLAKKAKVPVFGPHSLRHYFATQLLLKGVPVSHVSKLLGHQSIRTTERIYIHFLPDDLAGTTDVLIPPK